MLQKTKTRSETLERAESASLLPANGSPRNVPDVLYRRLVLEPLIDNVRGQTEH